MALWLDRINSIAITNTITIAIEIEIEVREYAGGSTYFIDDVIADAGADDG